ncbi:hypothetical protein BJY04DRAFT_1827 [Aspergillus karnatakaensis]|uniref:uncharacterized protein n=1 Tax=Aspergillus karnatakaensis TaxID=1810916 RepID=UPI003CCD170F
MNLTTATSCTAGTLEFERCALFLSTASEPPRLGGAESRVSRVGRVCRVCRAGITRAFDWLQSRRVGHGAFGGSSELHACFYARRRLQSLPIPPFPPIPSSSPSVPASRPAGLSTCRMKKKRKTSSSPSSPRHRIFLPALLPCPAFAFQGLSSYEYPHTSATLLVDRPNSTKLNLR